jgi:hypothetical protein
MDVFSRTFLPATAQAGLPITLTSRHMPVLRHCVAPIENTMLVTACHRPGHPVEGSFLLLLTNRSMVVTRESRLSRRVRLHLVARVSNICDVTWTADPRLRSVELVATMTDGVRERFWIPVRDVRRVRHLEAIFRQVFRRGGNGGRTGPHPARDRVAAQV